MSVNDKHVGQAPKVHRVAPRAKDVEQQEATVATAVPLDAISTDDGSNANQVSESPEETLDLSSGPATSVAAAEEDDDDVDLSMLEDGDGDGGTRIAAEDEPEEGFLEVYSEDCLSCASLVPFAPKTKKRKPCHYSAGNKHCPAQSTTIVIRVPLEEIVPRFMSAEKSRDFGRLAKLNTVLASKPDWYQQRVASALEEARAKQG